MNHHHSPRGPFLRPLSRLRLGLALAWAATLPAAAQPADLQKFVEVACTQEPPPEALAAFDQPAVRELWQARKRLAQWEASPDIAPLLDDLEKTSLDARRYFASLEQVAISRMPTFGQMPADLKRFVQGKVAENAGWRGTPEKYLALLDQVLLAGGDKAIADFIQANRAATAAVEAQPPNFAKSADPVAAASALERQVFTAWTFYCTPLLRVFTELTKAPIPTNFFLRGEPQAATFMTPAVPVLLKMRHDSAASLVDNLSVLNGQAPIGKSLHGPNLYPLMKRAVLDAVPATLTRIASMKDADLQRLRMLTTTWNMPGGWPYSVLAQQPAVLQAIADRQTELDGFANKPSDLPWAEKARRNLPPTRAEFAALITTLMMAHSQKANRLEFIRTGATTFDDIDPQSRARGTSQVDIFEAKCEPVAKGRKCSFIANIVRTHYLQDRPIRSYGLGVQDYSGVIQWGAQGLTSADLSRSVGGWVRPTARASSGGGGGRGSDADRDALNSGLAERSAAAEERRAENQRRYEEDQEQRRQRNRSCGPAPNICN